MVGWASVKGTDVRVGDRLIHGDTVKTVSQGQHVLGARFADVTTNKATRRCWEGFLYRVGRD